MVVSAQANIFGAGHSTPPDAGPYQIGPGILPPEYDFAAGTGQVLTFSDITGVVSWQNFDPNTSNGPNGGTGHGGTHIPSYGGISGITDDNRNFFLVGVFLDNTEPADPAPPVLDFTSSDPLTLSPQLDQTFFIGDGLTPGGDVKQFYVPPTATRLYLGFEDAVGFDHLPGGYGDNAGQLTATFTLGAGSGTTPSIPDCPSTLSLLLPGA